MMLTVSMTVSHLYQTWKTLKVSEALKRLLKVLIIAVNAQSHSGDAPSPLVWGWRSLMSIWEKADRLPRPCSYIVGVFDLIYILSLIHRLNLSLSCSTISLACQFIIWLFWQTWSVMADLWCSLVEDLVKFLSEIFSASFLCSVILVPSCLPVSPMYTFSHWLHGILYTTPAFFCFSTLSFGWTKTCLTVVWGLTTVPTLYLVNIRCIFSVNESCTLSFLDLSFLIVFFLQSGFARLSQ